jgi:hypothetical protein
MTVFNAEGWAVAKLHKWEYKITDSEGQYEFYFYAGDGCIGGARWPADNQPESLPMDLVRFLVGEVRAFHEGES